MSPRLLPFALSALAVPAACAPTPAPSARTPTFDAFRFFSGRSAGEGRLRVLFRAPVRTVVASEGRVEGDTLILVQHVREGAKPERTREWRLRQAAPGRYAGTLTDATGPVEATSEGSRLRIRYPMEGGLTVRQTLDLSPDGQRADNRFTVSKFGLTVARLHEIIVRQ